MLNIRGTAKILRDKITDPRGTRSGTEDVAEGRAGDTSAVGGTGNFLRDKSDLWGTRVGTRGASEGQN